MTVHVHVTASHRTDLSHSTFVLYLTVNKYDRDIYSASIAVLPLILVLGTLNPWIEKLVYFKTLQRCTSLLFVNILYVIFNYFVCAQYLFYFI